MRWPGSLVALALAGCAGAPVELPREVRVPVPVPCIEALPAAPVIAMDEALLALDDFNMVLQLAEDRKVLDAAYGELRALAAACVR